ncbi:MAG TPA: hypothetical protein VJ385_20735 [Fibrobacteria bacterium]|nr:hypothetical protein [Fibrobacteria bacterium]
METSIPSWTETEEEIEAKHRMRDGAEKVNRFTESVASRTPTLVFPFAALIAMAVSAALQLSGRRLASLFVGQWAPSLLLFGLYNKLSKTMGAD